MGSVGPYRLNQPLVLICMGEGEDTLVWYRNGNEYDKEMDPNGQYGSYRNTLVISELTRDMAGITFSCKVENFYQHYYGVKFQSFSNSKIQDDRIMSSYHLKHTSKDLYGNNYYS